MNKKFIKKLSKILVLSILFTNFSVPFTDQAKSSVVSAKNGEYTKIVKNIKDTIKNSEFFKRSVILYLCGRACNFIVEKAQVVAMRKILPPLVTTAADDLTDEQVEERLCDEIDKYVDRAPDVFEIEDSLIEKSHPKSLLLTLTKLNELFDKYCGFTDALIKYKRSQGEQFTLLPISIRYYPLGCLRAEELAEFDLGGIAFGNLGNYESTLYKYYNLHRTNWFAACDNDKLIEYTVAHEFGHVMEFLYITLQNKIDWKSCGKLRRKYTLSLIISTIFKDKTFKTVSLLKDSAKNIGNDILKRAKANKQYHPSMVSRYADSDVSLMEFFAETFAHSECSTYVNPLGQASQEYIKDWFPEKEKNDSEIQSEAQSNAQSNAQSEAQGEAQSEAQ